MGNGVDLALGTALAAAEPIGGGGVALTLQVAANGVWPPRGGPGGGSVTVTTRHLVNACGLGSRDAADMYGGGAFDINPRRGQFLVYDRHAASLVSRILLPLPTKQTKGMLVAPTVFGNLISGPTAEDLPLAMSDDPSTTADGLEHCRKSGEGMVPAPPPAPLSLERGAVPTQMQRNSVPCGGTAQVPGLADMPPIASYAGMRCHCEQGSYTIRYNDGGAGLTTVTGCRSTGFTASPALARRLVAGLVTEQGLELSLDPAATNSRPASAMPGWWSATKSGDVGGRPHDDPGDSMRPAYGEVVCSCEHVSAGEIEDALDSLLLPRTLDAVKRRTRAMTGRCQGFHCLVPTARMIAAARATPLHSVTKCGPGTEIAAGPVDAAAAAVPTEPPVEAAAGGDGSDGRRRYRAVVVGGGPAGVGAVTGLVKAGVAGTDILLIDRAAEIGGIPRRYGAGGTPSFVDWRRWQVGITHPKAVSGAPHERLHRPHTSQFTPFGWTPVVAGAAGRSSSGRPGRNAVRDRRGGLAGRARQADRPGR